MRPCLLLSFAALLGCGGGFPTTDTDPTVRQMACTNEGVSGTPFMAGPDTASAVTHQISSTTTPYAIALPAGADGYVGFHVSEIHTTIDVIVKQASDVGDVTKGGSPSDVVFAHDGIAVGVSPAPSCRDLFVYRIHVDVPGDFEIQLPSNAANETWLVLQVSQVGHDLP